MPTLFNPAPDTANARLRNDEYRNLAAAGGDVRESGRAQAREESGELAAEHVRREVDEHVAHLDAAVGADGKHFAAHDDFLLRDPVAFLHRALDGAIPFALARFPSEHDAGA